MGREKKNNRANGSTGQQPSKAEPRAPEPTRTSYRVCMAVILLGLVGQVVMAIVAYPSLPAYIPKGWLGWAQPGGTFPSWVVFLAFPGAQAIVLALAALSAKDSDGKPVMDAGKALSLILLAVLFTVLQASVFHLASVYG